MPNKEDAIFTYDTQAMQQFFEKMDKFFEKMDSNVKGVGKASKNTGKAISDGVKRGIKAIGKLGIAFLLIKKVTDKIPELGQTFKIAGEIMVRNFLWPLRKMLMPILQGILNWVRDNRAQFVRWGQHLANIFKGVIRFVQSAFKAIQSIIKGVMSGIQKTFGGASKSISDIMNIITFKFNAIMLFFGMILEEIGKAVGNFFEGFIETASPVINIIQELIGYITELIGQVDFGENAFKKFGQIVGAILTTIIGSTVMATMALIELFSNLISGARAAGAVVSGDFEGAQRISGEQRKRNEKFMKSMERIGGLIGGSWGSAFQEENVDDAIVTPDGRVLKTAPDDYIIATKSPGGNSVEVHMPIYVTVTEGNAEAAGRNVAVGINSTLRNGILGEMVKEGL